MAAGLDAGALLVLFMPFSLADFSSLEISPKLLRVVVLPRRVFFLVLASLDLEHFGRISQRMLGGEEHRRVCVSQ